MADRENSQGVDLDGDKFSVLLLVAFVVVGVALFVSVAICALIGCRP